MQSDPYRRRVKEVMVRDVVSVDPQDTLKEALELMVENRISALPAVDSQGRCVGVLSVTDLVGLEHELSEEAIELGRTDERLQRGLIEKLSKEGLDTRAVHTAMTDTPVSVQPETLLSGAAQEMLRHRVHRLVVLDQRRRLIGIISTMDVLGAFVEGTPKASEAVG